MQLRQLQATKYSTPGLNDDIGITITLAENSSKKKKEERKRMAEEISQVLSRRCMFIENLEDYRRYRQCRKDAIEVAISRILHKYGIKIEAYNGGQINGVCVRRLMDYSEDTIHIFLKVCSKGYVTDENVE